MVVSQKPAVLQPAASDNLMKHKTVDRTVEFKSNKDK